MAHYPPPDPQQPEPHHTGPRAEHIPREPSGPHWAEQPPADAAPGPQGQAYHSGAYTGSHPPMGPPGYPPPPQGPPRGDAGLPPPPWQPGAAGPRPPERRSNPWVPISIAVGVVALVALGASALLGIRLSGLNSELETAHDENAALWEEREEQNEAQRDAEEALEEADLPGLLEEVESLDSQFYLEILSFEEDTTEEEAADIVLNLMYECMNAREEYNTTAAEHTAHLPDDLPERLEDSDYDCGRAFWNTGAGTEVPESV